MKNKSDIHQQAAYYVTRLHSGELTAKEEVGLTAWRRERQEHEQALQTMLHTWDLAARLYSPVESGNAARQRRWPLLATAASILLVAVLSFLWVTDGNELNPAPSVVERPVEPGPQIPQPAYDFRVTELAQPASTDIYEYRSGIGEVSHIRLDDGSTLSLNTDTQVQVAYSADQRSVTLMQGEAFFNVAPDPARAFVIDTGEQIIRVLGTQFNVRKRDDEAVVQIAVVEGQVTVRQQAKNDEASENLLVAGDIGAFGEQSQLISQNKDGQVNKSQSWRHGIFRFDNESLEHVVREFNRYRNQKILIADTEANELRISGVFQLANDTTILSALESSLPIRVVRDNDYVFIYQR